MKKIGTALYVHKSNLKELDMELQKKINEILSIEPINEFDWAIIKIDKKSNAISFISSPDWDSASEPLVGDSYRFNCNTGEIKYNKARGQIYHHKWMFVSEDYTGFNVAEAKAWSEKWTNIIPKGHSSKYGYKKYWDNLLDEFGLRKYQPQSKQIKTLQRKLASVLFPR